MLPRVSALTYTVFESGDQAGPDGSRSQPLVRLRTGPPPPAAGITHRSFSSPRPLEQMNAVVVPSGDQAGATFSTYGDAVDTRPSNRLRSGPRLIALGETRLRHESFFMLSGSGPRELYNSHLPSPEKTGKAWTPRTWNASPPGAQVRRNHTSS